MISPPVCPPVSLSDPGQGSRPPRKHSRGLPTMYKHRPLQASSSVDLKCLTRWDIAVGTHACQTIRTRVWIPSHHRLTSLDQGWTPKYHHEFARGYTPPGRNDLPCVMFTSSGIEAYKFSIKYLRPGSFPSPERCHRLLL
jgi:hypothetical protein